MRLAEASLTTLLDASGGDGMQLDLERIGGSVTPQAPDGSPGVRRNQRLA